MQPLISLICPVYNCDKYLPDCVDSILRQTYGNWELILIDDGSKDKTWEICEQYTHKDSRIRAVHQKHKGTSAARNCGLQLAKGEYLLFIDGDDYVESGHIQALLSQAQNHDADICIGSLTVFDSDRNREISWAYLQKPRATGLLQKKQAFEDMIYRRGFGGEIAAKLFKASLIKGLTFDENETIGEDFTFNRKAMHIAEKIVFTDDHSYHYIRRSGSSSRTNDPSFFERRIVVAEKLQSFVEQHYPELRQAKDVFYTITVFNILHSYLKLSVRNYEKELKYQKILRSKLKNALFDRNLPFFFKLQLILLALNVKLYAKFRYIYIYIYANSWASKIKTLKSHKQLS